MKDDSLPTQAQLKQFALFVRWMEEQKNAPQTNFQKWKSSLTPEKVASALSTMEGRCDYCPAFNMCIESAKAGNKPDCRKTILKWAESVP